MEQTIDKKTSPTATEAVTVNSNKNLSHVINREARPDQATLDAAPIHVRINAAYVRARTHAAEAIFALVEAGYLLIQQRDTIKAEGGKWIDWLESNCPDISQATAYRFIKAAEYHRDNDGFIRAETARQLYIEIGAIEADSERGSDEKALEPEKTVLTPLEKGFKAFRLFYSDERLSSLRPAAAPRLLGWVRKVKDEMLSMEKKIVSKFGDKCDAIVS